MDARLCRLARSEALARVELGRVAAAFIEQRAYRLLGFVRLGDYARERLGISERELRSFAEVCAALEHLPSCRQAFVSGGVNWTKLRIVCAVADAQSESAWLRLAEGVTAERLRVHARSMLAGSRGERPALRGSVGAHATSRAAAKMALEGEGEIDGEPRAQFRMRCPARVRSAWRAAVRLARMVAGCELSVWQAAEAIAAEAISGAPVSDLRETMSCDHDERGRAIRGVAAGASGAGATSSAPDRDGAQIGAASVAGSAASGATGREAERDGVRGPERGRDGERNLDRIRGTRARTHARGDDRPTRPRPAGEFRERLTAGGARDADRRMRAVLGRMQSCDRELGRALAVLYARKLYRQLGYASAARYVSERLGLSPRKATALAALERKSRGVHGELSRAYGEGRVSWLAAMMLLPVLDHTNADAWIARAGQVTLRRLRDEIEWALDVLDAHATTVAAATATAPGTGARASVSPPSEEAFPQVGGQAAHAGRMRRFARAPESLPPNAAQIGADTATACAGAHRASTAEAGGSMGQVAFYGPASVVVLLHDAIRTYAREGEACWVGLDRVLAHVRIQWRSLPRHRDPVFERDGWRCAVPACSSRRNLHDHHVEYRSRGGSGAQENRIAVCAAHHLHGLHAGVVRAVGRAGHGVRWELGAARFGAPWNRFMGDVYMR